MWLGLSRSVSPGTGQDHASSSGDGGQPQASVWVSLSGSICHGSGQSHAWSLEQYAIIATFHVGVTLLGWLTETVIYDYIKTTC